MAQIEIGLGAVVEHVDFAVLIRAHGAGIDVDVGIELLQPDAQAALLQQHADGGAGQSLAERTDDAAGDENVLGQASIPQGSRIGGKDHFMKTSGGGSATLVENIPATRKLAFDPWHGGRRFKSNTRRALANRLPKCHVFAVTPLTSRQRFSPGLCRAPGQPLTAGFALHSMGEIAVGHGCCSWNLAFFAPVGAGERFS